MGQHIVKQLQEMDNDVKEIRIVDLQPYQNKLGKRISEYIWIELCFASEMWKSSTALQKTFEYVMYFIVYGCSDN